MNIKQFIINATLLTLVAALQSCASGQSTQQLPNTNPSSQTLESSEVLRAELSQTKKEIIDEIKVFINTELLPRVQNTSHLPKSVLKKQRKAKLSLKNKAVIGRIENIEVDNTGFLLKARIDTGAKTCSMHAEKVVEKEVDGKTYIQYFSENTEGQKQSFYKEVIRKQKVKSSNGETNNRYVVKMAIKLGGKIHEVNVNLNDREDLRYNFLVGRNLLMGEYIVDVSQTRLLGK